ncbi:MAG TPA: PHP domain-containing protein [Streptosporangiaceae bacterium]|nr:PHP domain-containing protein [Streptosporangiaceae bacterium]
MRADLHSHSSASDGTRPPAEVIARAAGAGLDAIALTDHDTVAGIAEAAAALPPGLALISGMELSCRRDGHSVHLLGYLFDPEHEELAAQCRAIRQSRVERAKAMVGRLADLGTGVTWEQVAAIAAGGVVGRPHIARAMIEAGVVGSFDEAFTPQWIGPGGRAHVRRYALDPAAAIALLHSAGGVAVLAHPLAVTRGWIAGEELIAELALAGLDGVEVAHPDHDMAQRNQLTTVARRLGLAKTGGSDDHGQLTGDRIGCETTGPEDLGRLLERASGAAVISR